MVVVVVSRTGLGKSNDCFLLVFFFHCMTNANICCPSRNCVRLSVSRSVHWSVVWSVSCLVARLIGQLDG